MGSERIAAEERSPLRFDEETLFPEVACRVLALDLSVAIMDEDTAAGGHKSGRHEDAFHAARLIVVVARRTINQDHVPKP